MELTPDTLRVLQIGPFVINATMVFSSAVTALLVLGALLATRRLRVARRPRRGQTVLEVVMATIRRQIAEALGELFGGRPEIRFERFEELLAGIELEAGDQRVAWSVRDYVGSLHDEVTSILRATAGGGREREASASSSRKSS